MLRGNEHEISDDSSDMFTDCSPIEEHELTEVKVHNDNDGCDNTEDERHKSHDERSWLGATLDEIRNGSAPSLPPISPSRSHTVFFEWPRVSAGKPPKPHPERMRDCWDGNHVRMPFSQHNLYPVRENADQRGLRQRWELIQEGLLKTIMSCQQLETAILSYNSKYSKSWDFTTLRVLFNEVLSEEETDNFFTTLLPQIIQLALRLPTLLTTPVPLLVQHWNHTLSFSQLQIASLLANAFLCTFPRRNTAKRQSEYATYPDINFNRLFQGRDQDRRSASKCEKLKCILHYFRRVCTEAPDGVVSYTRRCIDRKNIPHWDRSQKHLSKLHISSQGMIEDEGQQMLQVDFANKSIGGGVLTRGCVQEEIRFVICPELIVSRLFTEVLDSTEALLIVGCERFSMYKGYGDTFEWAGDYRDNTPRDSSGRRMCAVIAIDALKLGNRNVQYMPSNLMRELNKAYAGFYSPEFQSGERLPGVASGNWGCGAFRGDAKLKSLLQLMAASQAGRPLAYFTFGNAELRDEVFHIYTFLTDHQITVGHLWRLLCQYYDHSFERGKLKIELYPFLYQALTKKTTTLFDLPSGVTHSRPLNQDRSRGEGEQGQWLCSKTRGSLQESLAAAKERSLNKKRNKSIPHTEKVRCKDKDGAGCDSDIEESLADFFRNDNQEGVSVHKGHKSVGDQSKESSDLKSGSFLDSLERYERTSGLDKRHRSVGDQGNQSSDIKTGNLLDSSERCDRTSSVDKEHRSVVDQIMESSDVKTGSQSDSLERCDRTSQSRPSVVSTPSTTSKRKITDYFTPTTSK